MRKLPRLKLGYYLSVGCYNRHFRIFISLLTAKLFLFTYLTGQGIDSFMPAFGALILLLALSLLATSRLLQLTYLILLDILFSVVFFAQTLYYGYFGDFALVYQLGQVHQLKDIFHVLLGRTRLEYLFVADMVLLPLIAWRPAENQIMVGRKRAVVIYALIGILCNVNAIAIQTLSKYSYSNSFFFRYCYASRMGIVTYQICDISSYLLSKVRKIAVKQSDIATVMKWHDDHCDKAQANDLTGIARGLNLIAIQVESLQNFVIGRRYHGREITPNLNRLAREGIYCRNIFDQTGDGNSSDATFLSNCSLYPSHQGAVAYLYPQNRFDSLPALLKGNGYTTASLHAYRGDFWNRQVFDRTLGFEHQFYEESYVVDEIVGWGLSDRSFLTQSLQKIEKLPIPFYALVTTLSSHAPFDAVTDKIDNFPTPQLEGTEIGHYARSMHYVDTAIGEFLERLAALNLRQKTMLVIYGDHRARLAGSGLVRIGVTGPDEDYKVPLIISCPTLIRPRTVATVGGLIDVTPTVCNLLGVKTSQAFFLGKDLTRMKKGYVVFRNGTYISKNRSIDESFVHEQLEISDTIIDKDLIPLVRKEPARHDVHAESKTRHDGGT